MKKTGQKKFVFHYFSKILMALTMASTAYAVNPPDGTYGTVLLGVSYTPNTNIVFYHPVTAEPTSGTITHRVFGDIGIALGSRFCEQWRGEGEIFYNGNPYNQVRFGTVTINQKKSTGLGMKGQTTVGAFMVNGFYDFFTPGGLTSFVPYLGLGLGYSRIQNKITFYNGNTPIAGASASRMENAPAGQGVVGASYFLDDFSAFSLDYRYFTTKKIAPFDQRMQVTSLNLSFTGSLNFG